MIRFIIELPDPKSKDPHELDDKLTILARTFEDALHKVFDYRSIQMFKMEQAHNLLQIGDK